MGNDAEFLDVSGSTMSGTPGSRLTSSSKKERAVPPGVARLLETASTPQDPLCSARSTKSNLFPITSTDDDGKDNEVKGQPEPEAKFTSQATSKNDHDQTMH